MKLNIHFYFSYNLRLMSIWGFDKWSIKTEKLHRKNERQPLLWTSRCFLFILFCRLSSDTPNYSLYTGILAIQTINLHLKHECLHKVHCHCNALSLWKYMLAHRMKRLLKGLRVHFLFQWGGKKVLNSSPTAQNET